MPENPFDPQVIIPYSTLCELLQASVELKKMRIEVKRLTDQQSALRLQFVELMERFREIQD